MVTIWVDGKFPVELEDEIAATDAGIIDAVKDYYPGVTNGKVERKKDGTIELIKRAGPKG